MPLPAPKGKQKEVVYLAPEGHAVVLGTAGSGKTTMALHRAAHLSDERMEHGGTTLLVTFNNALVTYLNHLAPPELTNVDVRTYHHFARGYLNARGQMSYNCICDPSRRKEAIEAAVAAVAGRSNGDALLRRPLEFFLSEIQWINQHGLVRETDYVAVERVGRRGAQLARAQRPLMHEVFREYRRQREEHFDARYDWDDIATAVREELEADDGGRMYRHVVIDEGQDFSPEMLRSLTLAVPEDGSVTVFLDVAQQIYGRRMSWRSAGLRVEDTWPFKKNYRNSPQIARLGLAIAAMPYYADEPDMVEPDEFAAEGPMPVMVECASEADETAFVVGQARAAAGSGSVAILVRRNEDEAIFARRIRNAQRLYKDMRTWRSGPGISYGTYHAAKGLEFDTVILPRLTRERLPDPKAVEVEGIEDATAGDGRLLYVGTTRARRALIMSFAGELTELMPANEDLWQEDSYAR